ncbi:EpsG family protein [Scandinavium sp. V105_16]|uniref:EpsG family protein n=1 Tax=Scandinavium lactucae TaxID=3095028 RepID=A0AAJ2VV91_9ENTR|nr:MULTISPECIES: EpsG family protein [unclassified Scandinavium]MDX6019722.1 EpsG family protein [Scandinavium sp. V105_16]MDX6032832.1 EpsG family protein [Scandinavium sp. V105_12]
MYWVIFLSVCFSISIYSMLIPSLNKVLAIVLTILCFLFFVDGYFNGIDWVNYYSGFNDNKDILSFLSSFEPLFAITFYSLKYLTEDYYYSVILIYAIGLVALYRNSKDFAQKYDVNLALLITLLIFVNGIDLFNDQLRQFLAFVCSLSALRYVLLSRKKFYILSVLAVCFHYSAIVIFILYPFVKRKKIQVFWVGVFAALLVIFFTVSQEALFPLLSYLGHPGEVIGAKLAAYFSKFELKFGLLVIFDLLIIFRYILRVPTGSEFERIMWNGSFLAAILHISFYFMPIFQRFNPYFNVFYCLLFSHYFSSFFKRINRDGIFISLQIVVLLLSVNIGYFNDPARPAIYSSYFVDYVSGRYNLDKDKVKRCNEFVTDIPFCRW